MITVNSDGKVLKKTKIYQETEKHRTESQKPQSKGRRGWREEV